jgi:hypothetical protein
MGFMRVVYIPSLGMTSEYCTAARPVELVGRKGLFMIERVTIGGLGLGFVGYRYRFRRRGWHFSRSRNSGKQGRPLF